MTVNRALAYEDRLPESWLNTIQEFIGSYASVNFIITSPSSTTVKVAAGTDNAQVAIAINGRWRYSTSDVTASHPGGAPGSYDVYVTGSDNSFSGSEPETDSTVYAFGLAIRVTGSPPTTALYRKVGTLTWDGSSITSVTQTVGIPNISSTTSDLTARAGAATQVLIGLVGSAAGIAMGSAGDATLVRDTTGGTNLKANVPVNATAFQVAGVALAAANLSNGVTGSGTIVLSVSPNFTGTPGAPTAGVDTNTSQLATTAFVLGQAAAATPLIDGTGAAGTSTRYARADHVHPTDSSRSPLANPSFTGTVNAPAYTLNGVALPIVQTGSILMFGGPTAPSGYANCDGSSQVRTGSWAALFAVIGTLYGAADGSHFNLPDLQGRVPVGFAASGGHTDVSTLGGNDGVALANRRPKHNHSGTTGNQSVDHSHTGTTGVESVDHSHSGTTGTESVFHTHSGSTGGQSVDHAHDIPTGSGGGGGSFGNIGETNNGVTFSEITAGTSNDHSHAFTSGNQSALHTHTVTTGGVSAQHTHTVTTGGVSANHNHTVTVGPAGTNPIDAPAYLVVNYIIKL